MAFFRKLRAFFGFGDDESDEELNEKFLPYEAQHRTPYINPFKKEEENKTMEDTEEKEVDSIEPQADNKVNDIDELPLEMYNGVLSIINSTIPTFVRECLDVEAEKRAIAKSLGPHIKGAISKARQDIEAEAQKQWDKERAEMVDLLEQAEARSKEAAERAEQALTRVQSADAQRKAVTERCRTLENRVAELEAEREQFDLENKSLVNKIKVAQVHADDAAHYREEADELRRQLAELKEKSAAAIDAETEAKWSDEVARLQQEITTKDADIDALTKKAEETASQLADARKELDEALATLDIANEVQEQVDKLSDQIKARDAKIAAMREQWDKKEAEAARSYNEGNNANLDLKLQYDLLKAEAQKLREAVANADKDKEDAVAELQEHLFKAEKDNETLKGRIEALKQEVEATKKQAEETAEARDERSEDMKKQLEAAALLIERRDETIRQLNDKIGAIEGEMSFARTTDSENRLKIRQLTIELEKEREKSKQLSEQLASPVVTNDVQEEAVTNKKPGRRGRPKKSTAVKEVAEVKAEPVAEVKETVADVAVEEVSVPEPELEEAVQHVFKIDISDAGVEAHDDDADGDKMQVVAELEPLASEESAEPVTVVGETVEAVAEVLPIDNTVVSPVEPVGEVASDLLNDETNIDTTFADGNTDDGILDLEDDIEWLIPTAEQAEAGSEAKKVADDDFVFIQKKEEKEEKEEPRQQQMSLF